MKEKILTVIIKFILSVIIIGYLIVLFIRLSASITNLEGLNRDLLENMDTINAYFNNIEETNFLVIIFQWMFGDWGISFQINDPASTVLEPFYIATISVIIFSLIISAIVSLLIVHALQRKFGHTRHLRVFKGNWPSFIIVFILSYYILQINIDLAEDLIFNRFYLREFTQTSSFTFSIVLLSLLGVFKFLAEMNTIPSYNKETLNESTYPKVDTDVEYQPGETKISPTGKWLLACKPAVTIIPQYIIFLELYVNTPGLGNRLIQAIYFFDIPITITITFQFVLAILIARFLIDICLILTNNYEYQYDEYVVSAPKDSQSIIIRLFMILSFFILLSVVFVSIYYFFIGFNFGTDGLLKNPDFVNRETLNLPPFSEGYLLGTDYLGRDVFTQIVISPTIFFLPIFFAILIRPGLVLLVDLIPDLEGISISHEIFDLMDAIPKIPLTAFVWSIIAFSLDTLFVNVLVSIAFSFLFWGWIGKHYVMKEISTKGTLIQKLRFLIQLSIISAMIEYMIIDVIFAATEYGIGQIFLNALQNYPSGYFGVFISTLSAMIIVIVIPYIYFHDKISNS